MSTVAKNTIIITATHKTRHTSRIVILGKRTANEVREAEQRMLPPVLPQLPPFDGRFWPPFPLFQPQLPSQMPLMSPVPLSSCVHSLTASSSSSCFPSSPPKRALRHVKREKRREGATPSPQSPQGQPIFLPPYAHHLLNSVFLDSPSAPSNGNDKWEAEGGRDAEEKHSRCRFCAKQFGTQHGLVVHMRR